jgi:hypothetical protein
LYATHLTWLFFFSLKLTKALEATTPVRALKRTETVCRQRLLHEGPQWQRLLVMTLRQT